MDRSKEKCAVQNQRPPPGGVIYYNVRGDGMKYIEVDGLERNT